MTRRQCAKCPWKKGVDPRSIHDGYSEDKHRALASTIARPGTFGRDLPMMACHETPVGAETPCVGWLAHQLGPGNNLALRLHALSGGVEPFETVGPQHETFEATLPKAAPRRRS